LDPAVVELFDTLRAIRDGGPGAFGAYVISMARSASDVLLVELLQREAGIDPPLRVVPLFETLADLRAAEGVVRALLADADFVRRLPSSEGVPRFEIMVGYSDSTKDAGRLGSAWAIHGAIEAIARVATEARVEPIFFHGRGGTVGRGGAPIRDSMLSLPAGTLRGSVRVTVQGEAIESTLGLEPIALESLDRYVAAVLESELVPPPPPLDAWRAEMDRLAASATATYRAVVHDTAGEASRFVPYFRAVTPERELGMIHAGSRPARRVESDDVASLRAIPWVFAWNQARLMLPSWLGVGDAFVEALADPERLERVTAMGKEWPFFRSLVGLVSMSLAKGDPAISQLYEAVLVPPDLAPIGEALRSRFAATERAVLAVVGSEALLESDPSLQTSIALRNPYIDPLNILQAELLRRMRADAPAPSDVAVIEAFLVTVNGIAAGLRNTG
jgi:phosphoenolpyruvate carboxylase